MKFQGRLAEELILIELFFTSEIGTRKGPISQKTIVFALHMVLHHDPLSPRSISSNLRIYRLLYVIILEMT